MNTEKSLCNVNFYMNTDVRSWLTDKFGDEDNINLKSSFGDDNYSFDVIDQPIHCEINVADGDVTFLMYIRSDFGIYEEWDANLHIVFHMNGEEPSMIQQNGIGGDVSATALIYLKVAAQLRKQISDSFYESISDLDIEKDGVLISLGDDDISFERVSGRERPAMICNSLFEGMRMARPYKDEQMSQFMREMMSMDEKLARAEDGDEEFMDAVAMAYLNGNDEVEQDFEKSAYWWEKLAQTGNSNAQFNMGLLYAKGCGVSRDFEKAIEWLNKAIENGDDDAQRFCEICTNVKDNLKKAETGDANAQAALSKLFTTLGGILEQYGSDDDYKAAFEWAKKAAEQGNALAMRNLGRCYQFQVGTDYDMKKAIYWYEKSLEYEYDEELAQKVMIFKSLEEVDEEMDNTSDDW